MRFSSPLTWSKKPCTSSGARNHGKFFFYAGVREILLFPGHLQGNQEEKLDGGDKGANALGGEFPFLAQMELILADGLQVQLFGAAVEVFGELGDIMDVAALGGGREVAKAHIVDHALTQLVSCDGSLECGLVYVAINLIQS